MKVKNKRNPSRNSMKSSRYNFLDILICSCFGPYKAQEEALGVKVIDPERNPLLFSLRYH